MCAAASDIDEFRIDREEVFAFARKPAVTRDGDRVTIAFETTGFCDVTVAIEESSAKVPGTSGFRGPSRKALSPRVVRHLASGVLGPNAPAPFAKNARRQTLVWDGKDDFGAYVDDVSNVSVRVSLGLRPRFERTLFWDPHKRFGPTSPIPVPAPEGVYVFDGQVVDSVRLFDHDGGYVRTLYPFAAAHLDSYRDLHWQTFPPGGVRLPLREGEHQATLLPSGDNTGFGTFGIGPKHQVGSAASAMAVGGGRMVLAKRRVCRFGTDGGSGGRDLGGPRSSVTVTSRALPWRGGGKPVEAVPISAALSPDGRFVYLAGYTWTDNMGTGGRAVRWLHGVARVPLDGSGDLTVFAGSLKDKEHGAGPRQFHVPTSVACDAKGRVVVADHRNDRLQVFEPDGRLVRSIAIKRPARVAIHHKTGEVYVFSWRMNNYDTAVREERLIRAVLTRLAGLDDPRVLATAPVPLRRYDERLEHNDALGGRQYTVALDSWRDPPAIWLVPGGVRGNGYRRANIQVLVERDGQLETVRDFGAEVAGAIGRDVPPARLRQRLAVNPRTGLLYLIEGDAGVMKSTGRLLELDPATGRSRIIELPFDAEDLTFDLRGQVYLRSLREIVRYDPITWREVPFDYGEARAKVGFATSRAEGPGMRRSPAAAAIRLPVHRYNHHGGMMVAPDGTLAVAIHGGQEPAAERREGARVSDAVQPYTFRLYPGRCPDGLVLLFDRHGRAASKDAVPGIAFTHGIGIDRNRDLYLMAMACRVLDGKRYFNEATDTLLKVTPEHCKVLSAGNRAPIALPASTRPKRPPDLEGRSGSRIGRAWVEGAHWFYGGVGFHARHGEAEGFGCDCFNSRFCLDYFARSFAPEVGRSSVAVLDASGNLICRVGRYGNVDDGDPLIRTGGPARPRSIGGDELALFYAPYVATHTDRRLFAADPGNARIVSVELGYHATERVALKDVTRDGS